MYEDLEMFLRTKVSHERTKTIIDAASSLDTLSTFNHQLEIQTILYENENIETFDVVYHIETVIVTGLKRALNNFSVFTESNHLALLSAILTGIQLLTEYEDTESILAICTSDDDPETKLADLIELITSYPSDDIQMEIERVNPRLIERLYNLTSEKETRVEELPEEDQSIDPVRQRLRTFINDETYIISEAIADGLPLGMDHSLLEDRFVDQIEVMSAGRAADETVAILMASSLPTEDIGDKAKEYLEDIFSEPNFISTASLAVDESLRGFGENA